MTDILMQALTQVIKSGKKGESHKYRVSITWHGSDMVTDYLATYKTGMFTFSPAAEPNKVVFLNPAYIRVISAVAA